MKDILFPVNDSTRSEGLMNYIGNLAHDTHAKVFLVAAETARQKNVDAVASARGDSEGSKLNEAHDYLVVKKHVESGIENENMSGDPYKKFGSIANRHNMVVVPTAPQSTTVTNDLDLARVVNETHVPIFLLPESYNYKKIKCLIYAYDYKNDPEPPLAKLSQLASWFSAEVRFISVFAKDTLTKERDKVHEMHVQLLKAWKGGNKISFDTIVYPQIPNFAEQYLGQPEQGDLQVLSVSNQSFLDKLLRRGLIEELKHSKNPYVIIHK